MGESISHTLEQSDSDVDIYENTAQQLQPIHSNDYILQRNMLQLLVVKHLYEMNEIRKQTVSIQIECTSTIRELKQKIALKFRIDIDSFHLSIPNLKPLYRDELTLSDYNISNGQILCAEVQISAKSDSIDPMIAVYYNNNRLQLNNRVKTYNTVFQLKTVIQELHSIPIQCQTLYFKDNDGQKVTLCDNELLNDYRTDAAVYFRDSAIYLQVNVVDENVLSLVQSIDFRAMDDECSKIYRLFWRTMQSPAIEMVNMYKIEQNVKRNLLIYNNVLNTMENKTEDILFHGTSLENIEKIILNGFNRDCNKRSVYGKGTYFSKSARMAAHYSRKDEKSGVSAMLVCKVIIGHYGLGHSTLNKSALYKPDGVQQFDSLVNDLNNPSIFVINRDYHAVPVYIIVFKKRDSEQHKTQQRASNTKMNNTHRSVHVPRLYTQQERIKWLKANGYLKS